MLHSVKWGVEIFLNGERERIWKEVVVVYFSLLSRIRRERLTKIMKNVNHDIRQAGQDLYLSRRLKLNE
jgi:hypothetical protein